MSVEWKTCQTCDGKGTFYGEQCDTCNGVGKVVAAPVAQLDADLPPLPSDDELREIWRIGRRAGNEAWSHSDCETTMHVWQVRKTYEAIAANVGVQYVERIRHLERELAEHKAARIAYASEFPPNADGEPDVGSIHANIRALKHRTAGTASEAWQPIETAPTNMARCLYLVGGFCVQGFVDATGELMVQSEVSPHWRKMRGKPTHWMPLAAAPSTQEGANEN